MYEEPYCVCQMLQMGLPLNEEIRKAESEKTRLANALAEFAPVPDTPKDTE